MKIPGWIIALLAPLFIVYTLQFSTAAAILVTIGIVAYLFVSDRNNTYQNETES